MHGLTLGLTLLVAVFSSVPRALLAQCPTHALSPVDRQAYRDDIPEITVIFPAGMFLELNVGEALDTWSTSCAAEWTSTRPLGMMAVAGPSATPGQPARPAGMSVRDSIQVHWLQNTPAPLRDPENPLGGYRLAHWPTPREAGLSYSNTINLYGINPIDGSAIPWHAQYFEGVFAHEIGHAMGLGHDPGCLDSLMTDEAVLTDEPPFSGALSVAHCKTVDNMQKMNCRNLPPPLVPDSPTSVSCPEGCDCDVDPISPIEELENFCSIDPFLCEQPGGRVWFNSPMVRPTQVCTAEWTCTSDPAQCFQVLEFMVDECCTSKLVCRWIWEPADDPVALVNSQEDLRIVLFEPNRGTTLTGSVVIRGVALQNSPGVQGISFWVDNQRVPVTNYTYGLPAGTACNGWTDPSCPNVAFSATLDTRLLANGSHILQVVADDRATITPEIGYLAIPINISNCVSTRSPTAILTAPTAGSTLQGTVTLNATASDDGRIERVEFRVNGNNVATDQTSPYSKTWNTVGFPNGTVTLTAKAYDMCGNSGISAPVTATVNNAVPNNPPQASIDVPAHNANVTTRNLAVYGWATDGGGVPSFTFTVDGQPRVLTVSRGPRADVCSAVPVGDPNCPNVGWGVTLDTYGLAAGAHTIVATAIDNLGAAATVSRTFQIVNASPNAWVGYPGLGRTVSGPGLSVVGYATDTDGVESVRLEIDNQPVTLLAPWSRLSMSNVCAAGSPLDPSCPNVGYKMRFNSTAFPDGVRSLRVIVRDTRGVEAVFPHSLVLRNNPVGTRATRPAAADTFIRSSLPTSTAGGTSTLLYASGVSSDLKYTFLRFDLSGIPGQLVAARLKLTPKSAAASRANVWNVTAGAWGENTLNWNGLGGLTFSLFDVFFDLPTVPAGSIASLDVTDMVALGGLVTIGISTDSLSDISFASREFATSSQRPTLEIWTH